MSIPDKEQDTIELDKTDDLHFNSQLEKKKDGAQFTSFAQGLNRVGSNEVMPIEEHIEINNRLEEEYKTGIDPIRNYATGDIDPRSIS